MNLTNERLFVYILECGDGSYYTGVTLALEKRIHEQNSGFHKGYTSSRLPVKLFFSTRITNVNEQSTLRNELKDGAERKRKL